MLITNVHITLLTININKIKFSFVMNCELFLVRMNKLSNNEEFFFSLYKIFMS